MAKGRSLSRIRAWVDDHTPGTFACDREYSWDDLGGAIMFHEGQFKGISIRHTDSGYMVIGVGAELSGIYGSQKDVINRILIPLTNYAYKEIK